MRGGTDPVEASVPPQPPDHLDVLHDRDLREAAHRLVSRAGDEEPLVSVGEPGEPLPDSLAALDQAPPESVPLEPERKVRRFGGGG